MQFAVTGFRYVDYKKNKILKSNILKLIIISTLIIITFLTLTLSYLKYDKNDYLNVKKFYYVSISKSNSSNKVKEESLKVKEMGGAGYLLNISGINHLLVFGYMKREDAMKVKDQLDNIYPSVEIIERIIPAIKRKIRSIIINEISIKNIFKNFDKIGSEIYNLCLNFDKLQVSISEINKILTKTFLDLQDALNIINSNKFKHIPEEITVQIKTSLNFVVEAIKTCISEVYKGENISSNLKLLFVNICEGEFYLKENLNKF